MIKAVPARQHVLLATCIGYKKYQEDLIVRNREVILNFTLDENVHILKEVSVGGEGSKTQADEIRQSAFNVNAIETRLFENTTADVNSILGKTTGVRIRETGGLGSDFTFFLNGLSGRQVKFFIDGQPLENYGSVFNLNNIPINQIERIEVYKGAVPVHLGADALGGAINIITKQGLKKYLDASYSDGSFNTHRVSASGLYRDSASGFTIRPTYISIRATTITRCITSRQETKTSTTLQETSEDFMISIDPI